jgi:NAD(P)-dependent dehydrogenase (short-subunit alcohol dehydrogenase family)
LVIGGSSGVGKSTVLALLASGVHVTAVARTPDKLRSLGLDAAAAPVTSHGTLTTVVGDATDDALVERLLRDAPDFVVLAGGVTARSAMFTEFNWETFSEAWNNDLQMTFHVLKRAHALPMKPGTTIVVVSSGAAVNGSPISGGYAGAKRMQWLLSGYAQKLSDRQHLGIRTVVVVPKQLIEGTATAAAASTVYGAMEGLTSAQFMQRYGEALTPAKVASAIVGLLRGDVAAGVSTVGVTGTGVDAMP